MLCYFLWLTLIQKDNPNETHQTQGQIENEVHNQFNPPISSMLSLLPSFSHDSSL